MAPLAFDIEFHYSEKPLILSSSQLFSTSISTDGSYRSLRVLNTACFRPYGPELFLSFFLWQSPVLRMAEGDTIYDYCWYPKMNSLDPDTCL